MILFEPNAAILRKLPDDTLEILSDKLCSKIPGEICELQYDCETCLRLYIEEKYK